VSDDAEDGVAHVTTTVPATVARLYGDCGFGSVRIIASSHSASRLRWSSRLRRRRGSSDSSARFSEILWVCSLPSVSGAEEAPPTVSSGLGIRTAIALATEFTCTELPAKLLQ